MPYEILPKEYGGKAESIEVYAEKWAQKLHDYEAFFAEEVNFGVDESKRPGKPKDSETYFGLDGSFKQLEIF